jgi:hypothetical protein
MQGFFTGLCRPVRVFLAAKKNSKAEHAVNNEARGRPVAAFPGLVDEGEYGSIFCVLA